MTDRERRFLLLVSMWEKDTGHLSSPNQMTRNPAFRQIIEMGSEAVPLILRNLEAQPSHLFLALHEITGVRLEIPNSDQGKIKAIALHWIKWGKANGHF